jgi:hypothetical protein
MKRCILHLLVLVILLLLITGLDADTQSDSPKEKKIRKKAKMKKKEGYGPRADLFDITFTRIADLTQSGSQSQWRPNKIIDIGANVGAWNTKIRQYFPDSNVLSIEADPRHTEVLTKQGSIM